MRNNPRDWQIADLKVVAGHYGLIVRQSKGSHVTFAHSHKVEILTVPAHRPIKPIYIKKLLIFIDSLQEDEV